MFRAMRVGMAQKKADGALRAVHPASRRPTPGKVFDHENQTDSSVKIPFRLPDADPSVVCGREYEKKVTRNYRRDRSRDSFCFFKIFST
jgi:hypothetical protein